MKKLVILFFLLFATAHKSSAQQLFHQDIFYGGVTAAGFSTGISAGTTFSDDTITIHIEPGSTIRNAWLFVYSFGHPTENSIVLDGELIEIDTVEHLLSEFIYPCPQCGEVRLYGINVENIVNNSQNQYSIEILNVHNELNWGYWSPILYVEYKNASLNKINTSLWFNDQNGLGESNYLFEGLNPIEFNEDISLSIFSDRFVGSNPSKLYLNSLQIGEFTQNDSYNTSTNGVGVQGHFYYQNGQLFGLGDDNPDSTMFGSDGIAVINDYLSIGDISYEFRIEQHLNPSPFGKGIVNMIFPHAYTTPCDTFSTSIIADTSVCLGDSLQLFASGGNGYEWVNPLGMDNPTLAQPKVAPDSAFRYVVRIENEPGCTRTESVFVEVLPKPVVDSVSLTAEVCGNENGQLNVYTTNHDDFTYSLDALSQSNPTFSNLISGEYNLSVTDSKGCSLDSTLFVPLTIAVEASFSASPESGGKPLDVEFTNTSQNATHYEWYIDSLFWDDTEHTAAYFDSIGEYQVQLFAFNKRPACVDSATFTILVFDTIYARIPNVFTPNNDGVNDVFTINVRGASEVNASFFNRWGNEMHTSQLSSSGFEQTIPLWDGTTLDNQSASDGTYFYTISITSIAGNVFDFQGHVQVVNE